MGNQFPRVRWPVGTERSRFLEGRHWSIIVEKYFEKVEYRAAVMASSSQWPPLLFGLLVIGAFVVSLVVEKESLDFSRTGNWNLVGDSPHFLGQWSYYQMAKLAAKIFEKCFLICLISIASSSSQNLTTSTGIQ